MTSAVKIADSGHVRTVTLNRPDKKNALSDVLAWGVIVAVEDAARDDNVWVIAITGSGDSFCTGLDFSDSERFSPLSGQSAQLDDISWVGNFLLAIRKRCDKPVVGGINGVAVGAGLGLAMATDVRLVSRSAKLMAGYTRIRGSPDGGLTITLPQAMAYENTMRFDGEPDRPGRRDSSPGNGGRSRRRRQISRQARSLLPTTLRVVADYPAPPEARHGKIAGNVGP